MQHSTKSTDLTKTCAFLKLNLSRLGDKRGVSSDEIEVDANKDYVKVRKIIFKSASFDSIRSLDSKIRRYIRDECFPYEPGFHLISLQKAERVNDQLKEFYAERIQRISTFAAAFPKIIANMPDELRKLYNEKDYRNIDNVQDEFNMDWQFLEFTAPTELGVVNTAVFEESRKKMKQQMQELFEQTRLVYRETALEIIQALRVALEPDVHGAPKRLSSLTVEKLQKFIRDFDIDNVTNDTELERHKETMRRLLGGVDAEALREADGLRARVRTELQHIEVAIAESVQVAPKRRIRTVEA